MTAAQKTAKAKFKQAIAYRQKTGVSLKEAFAHIYGKKVGAVKKKAAPKKKAAKKVAKKVIRKVVKKSAPKKVAKKKLTPRDYDLRYSAKKPGKRTSASGNTYYDGKPLLVKEGSYVLCRSGLDYHWTDENESSRERISLSFGYFLPETFVNRLNDKFPL